MTHDVTKHYSFAYGKHGLYQDRHRACANCLTKMKRIKTASWKGWICPKCDRSPKPGK